MKAIPHKHQAFTLVELLVVIGIIALLISILLPALSKAKEQANTVACLANLRAAASGMQIYASDNHDAIIGSPSTSSHCMWAETAGSFKLDPAYAMAGVVPPGQPIDLYDYVGPLCDVLKISLPNTTASADRYYAYRDLKQFRCPSNDVLSTPFHPVAGVSSGTMLSYNTAMGFLVPKFRSGFQGLVTTPGTPYWAAPDGYSPKVARVGRGSEKIFMADAGRWFRPPDAGPTFTIWSDAKDSGGSYHLNTSYSDFGPFWGATKSYGRGTIPGNISPPTEFDARIMAYRHGNKKPGGAVGSYRMNAVFFDGHAETMDDANSSNPDLWLPKGTYFDQPNGPVGTGQVVWPDVRKRFNIASGYVVQN